MGKPMMIVHADGSETVARQEALPLIGAEHDLNAWYFHKSGDWPDYAVTVKWNADIKDAEFEVAKIGDPDAAIPDEVAQAGEQAVRDFMAMLDRQHENRMYEASAPHFLADAVDGNEGWVHEAGSEMAELRTPDGLWFAMVSWSAGKWHAMGYHSLHAEGAERLKGTEFTDLNKAMDYCSAYIDRHWA